MDVFKNDIVGLGLSPGCSVVLLQSIEWIFSLGGVLFLILGMMLHVTTIWVFLKLLAIAIFIFISSPTASHAIANAAFVTLGYKKKKGERK